jgi:hypothetical protein
MADYVCVIQAGQAADRSRDTLADGLRRIGRDAFGDDPEAIDISWRPVERGFAWTAGEPSIASLIIRSVPVGFPDDRRERFLSAVTELWTSATGCASNDVVVTAWDGPLPV